MSTISPKSPVGINGIGRIGKLLVWVMSTKSDLEEIVISTGRKTGKSLEDLAPILATTPPTGPTRASCSGSRRKKL